MRRFAALLRSIGFGDATSAALKQQQLAGVIAGQALGSAFGRKETASLER